MRKAILVSAALFSAVAAYSANPSISDVTVIQHWPWSGEVDIYYNLTSEEACDVEVSATWTGQATPFVLNDISGDYVSVSDGNRHIVWDPVASGLPLPLKNFTVTLTPVAVTERKYLIFNLKNGSVTYSPTEPDWKNHEKEFLGTNMVFRRISATTFNFGYPRSQINQPYIYANNRSLVRKATLSSDYYMAIFPFTAAQGHFLNGTTFSNEGYYRTPRGVTYSELRGATTDGICWPETFHAVTTDSFAGKLRQRAANSVPREWKFDLPTAAQWENAARAGTDSTNLCYLAGAAFSTSWSDMTNILLNAVNWSPDGADAHVGDYAPNPWGIYDTIGCLWEFVLDWRLPDGPTLTHDVIDPTGIPSDSTPAPTTRQARGGRCRADCTIAMLMPGNSNQGFASSASHGVRFCIHLKPITQISN